MSIIAALLLPIIVVSHLTAQWYLFRFIGYHAFGWMRGGWKNGHLKSIQNLSRVTLFAGPRRWLFWGSFIALLVAVISLARGV